MPLILKNLADGESGKCLGAVDFKPLVALDVDSQDCRIGVPISDEHTLSFSMSEIGDLYAMSQRVKEILADTGRATDIDITKIKHKKDN